MLDPAVSRESVWDYPRPPRLEPTSRRIRVVHAGILLADTTHALRILETSHPPVYYIPRSDLRMEFLQPLEGKRSFCEFKGEASYWNVDVSHATDSDQTQKLVVEAAAWSYEKPLNSMRNGANKPHSYSPYPNSNLSIFLFAIKEGQDCRGSSHSRAVEVALLLPYSPLISSTAISSPASST